MSGANSASGPNFDPITGLPIQRTKASRNTAGGKNAPIQPASDVLGGTIPVTSNTPAPPVAGATPVSPPLPLPKFVEAIYEIGSNLSPEAAGLLFDKVKERDA